MHPIDPYVVRKLAECLELLPRYINSPQKMPFVQEVIKRALEQINSDREALVQGHEALAQGDEVEGRLHIGRKYRLELRDAEYYRKKAEDYRKPVTSVWLSDTDKEAIKAGFEDDETGIFEHFERQAAEIAEWLREHRHPRDAENFRNRFSFVCGEALLYSQGVEVSPGVYKLDLCHWETEVAKPLCDDLQQFADEMETEQNLTARQQLRARIEVNTSESKVRLDDTWYDVKPDAAVLFDACVKFHPKPIFASHLDDKIRPKRIKDSLPRQLKAIFHSAKGQGCWLEISPE